MRQARTDMIFLLLGPMIGLAGLWLQQALTGADTLSPSGVLILLLFILFWVQMVLIPRSARGVPGGPRRAMRWLRMILGTQGLMVAAFARPEAGADLWGALVDMLTASIPALVLAGFALSKIGTGLLRRRKIRRIMRKQTLLMFGGIAVIVVLWTFWRGWGAAHALWTGAVMLGGLACLIWPFGLSRGAASGAPRHAALMAEVLSSGACLALIHVLMSDPAAPWSWMVSPLIGGMVGLWVAMYFQRALPPYRL